MSQQEEKIHLKMSQNAINFIGFNLTPVKEMKQRCLEGSRGGPTLQSSSVPSATGQTLLSLV